MTVRGALAAGAVLAALVVASGLQGSPRPSFVLAPGSASAGERVTVRLAGTPARFTRAQRQKPLRPPIRLYVVPEHAAGDVRNRFDPRLHFVGTIVPDRRWRGVATFTTPPLDTGDYALAAWCPGCPKARRGPAFGVADGTAALSLVLPDAADGCPVTRRRAGNGLLSTVLSADGSLVARRESDGTLFQKLFWLPHGMTEQLSVQGERLDVPDAPMQVLGVNWGTASTGPAARGSWATAVLFPSEGCWRITGRVADVSLTYVARVVAG